MANRAVEIHDSVLNEISIHDHCVILDFSSIYLHQSSGRPGIDAGPGFVQKAMIRISDGVVDGSFADLPCDLADGDLKLGESFLSNLIPLTLNFVGGVELRIVSRSSTILVKGNSIDLELFGEPRYLEEFRPS